MHLPCIPVKIYCNIYYLKYNQSHKYQLRIVISVTTGFLRLSNQPQIRLNSHLNLNIYAHPPNPANNNPPRGISQCLRNSYCNCATAQVNGLEAQIPLPTRPQPFLLLYPLPQRRFVPDWMRQ